MTIARLALIVGCLFLLPALVARGEEELQRGRKVLSQPAPPVNAGKTWALIVGINYQGREKGLTNPADRAVIPPLKNAVNDAQKLAETLKKYYGYDDEHLILLTEEQATDAAIDKALGRLCNSDTVAGDDSLVVFFSGHGVQLAASADRVAFLPYDVEILNGRPTALMLPLHTGLFEKLKSCPARNKLAILDFCYSGEIFHSDFQPRSENGFRDDKQLQEIGSFQAMASCRSTQQASDGPGENSPFTKAIVDGLKHLPTHNVRDQRVWSTRLLHYIRPQFRELPQKPDLRSFQGTEGEFTFYPLNDPKLFEEFRVKASERSLLQAMVASRQGNWWFEEIPWFFPSVRDQILKVYEQEKRQRSADWVRFIEPQELKTVALQAMTDFSADNKLDQFRRHCFARLASTHNTDKFEKELALMEAELRQLRETPTETLSAADIHFLAVLQQALGQEAEIARETYLAALKAYDASLKNEDNSSQMILKALCQTDLGELLMTSLGQPAEAAKMFREADNSIRQVAGDQQQTAGMFRTFVLCRAADALAASNLWQDANACLLEALDLAKTFAARDHLTAYVMRRRAWTEFKQWNIAQAEDSFRQSNNILMGLFERGVVEAEKIEKDVAAVSAEVPASGAEAPRLLNDAINDAKDFEIPEDSPFWESKDFVSRIAYLHNLHGLAMAKRFRGNTPAALHGYRALSGEVENTFGDFRLTTFNTDLEQQLLERVINTLERMADCNLFGNPETRDVSEAIDDYRRALNRTHSLRGSSRDQQQAMLMYKQALALALCPNHPEPELAGELCREAALIQDRQVGSTRSSARAFGQLATKIVTALMQTASQDKAWEELRTELFAFRDAMGDKSPSRDELEMALFSAKALLEMQLAACTPEQPMTSRQKYLLHADANLLLSFCRLALRPSARSQLAVLGQQTADARAYLRPYYDTVVAVKLSITPVRVKELLELQWEATTGEYYVKKQGEAPILAIYAMQDKCYLIVDIPRGQSQFREVGSVYTFTQIQKACYKDELQLPLPVDLNQALSAWRNARLAAGKTTEPQIETRFEDTVRGLARRFESTEFSKPGTSPPPAARFVQFPFRLPDGYASPSPGN